MTEKTPKKKPPSREARKMSELFAGNDGAHGTHGVPVRDGLKWEIKQTASTVRTGPTVEMWDQHLSGERPLGVIPVRPDGSCSWASIDVDQYDTDLLKIVDSVERHRMPLVPCVSKSGGLHLFLFLDPPAQATTVISALREMSAILGLSGSEIFPKQVKLLTERGETGNWMVMPYFGGTFDGKLKMQVGLKKTGGEQTIGEFIRTAEAARTTEDALSTMTARRGPATVVTHSKSSKKGSSGNGADPLDHSDGPPCLEHLAAVGCPEGGRNNALLMEGMYLKKKRPSDWQEHLERYNRTFMKPPLSADEVTSAVRSLTKKDYQYTCRTEPMVRHCHSAKCRTRPYGVGEGNNFPVITAMQMMKTDPTTWFVEVEGGVHLEVDGDVLQNYRLFHKACMNEGVCFSMMKESEWMLLMGQAFAKQTEMPVPPDLNPNRVFLDALEDFLVNRQAGDQKDDLLSGRPWANADKGKFFFRLRDLMSYLERQKVRITKGRVVQRIRELGGAQGQVTSTKRITIHCWWVPYDAFQQPEEIPTPRPTGKEI